VLDNRHARSEIRYVPARGQCKQKEKEKLVLGYKHIIIETDKEQ
jgi:hypothetical protein